MAKLTTAQRKKLTPGKFVFPKGTQASPGRPAFPIHDVKHGRAALSRAAQRKVGLSRAERCRVVQTVCRKYPSIASCEAPSKRRGMLASC